MTRAAAGAGPASLRSRPLHSPDREHAALSPAECAGPRLVVMRDGNEDRTEGHVMAQKTWFITGTSRGFGREWAIAALDRGDQVAATARDVSTLDGLMAKYGDAS